MIASRPCFFRNVVVAFSHRFSHPEHRALNVNTFREMHFVAMARCERNVRWDIWRAARKYAWLVCAFAGATVFVILDLFPNTNASANVLETKNATMS